MSSSTEETDLITDGENEPNPKQTKHREHIVQFISHLTSIASSPGSAERRQTEVQTAGAGKSAAGLHPGKV